MNSVKTGDLIRKLRKERGMTQKQLADELHVSDRAVSKWERGAGSPDVSLLTAVSRVLGVDVQNLLDGGLDPNDTDGGNMKRIRFYRCSSCGNVLTSSAQADISCCGRKLEPLHEQESEGIHSITVTAVEDELFATVDHPMSKDHHIAFLACSNDERVVFVRMYPEQAAQARFPYVPNGRWYACCSEHGLYAL